MTGNGNEWISVYDRNPTKLGEYPIVDAAGNISHALFVEDRDNGRHWIRIGVVDPVPAVRFWYDLPPRPDAEKLFRIYPDYGRISGECQECKPEPNKAIWVKDGKCRTCGQPVGSVDVTVIEKVADERIRKVAHEEIASVLKCIAWDKARVTGIEGEVDRLRKSAVLSDADRQRDIGLQSSRVDDLMRRVNVLEQGRTAT